MNLTRYEIFLKVVECGSITRAAEALYYTQAGVSHAVAALEKETGVSLLIRSANGVTLTENGKRLLNPIQSLVREQRNLSQRIYEINNVMAGVLRVGTFTSVSTEWLPELIKGFRAAYPQVEFELITGDYDEITDRIRSGKIDCGFLTAPVPEELLFVPLYRDPMLVLLPPGHPLAAKQAVTLTDIEKEPFILPMKGSDNDILAVLKKENLKISAHYTLNDDFSILAMVAGGFGVTIMQELVLRHASFRLAVRPLDPPQYRTIGIAALPANRESILTKTFLQYLADRKSAGFFNPVV